MRIICWLPATTRSFVVVGRVALSTSPSWMAASAMAWRSASLRGPMRPTSVARAPSAVILRATLPAPPGMALSRPRENTGTGASGEMRSTLP